MTRWSFETRQIHAGAQPDPTTGARATPLYQTTSFVFDNADHAAAAFALQDLETHAYSRLSNPTTAVVEGRLADLENGYAAVAVASGQAASALAVLNLARVGDHIVSAATLYGGTYNLFAYTLQDMGIEVTFVTDPDSLDAWRAAVRPNTKAFYAETVGNPLGNVLDITAVASVAHSAGVPLIVDNTVPTPFLTRPIDHGADIVVHSTTKFLSGHGTGIGGVIIDSGQFPFDAAPSRWPSLSQPDPSYNGLEFGPSFGKLAYLLRLRTKLVRDLGPAVSPFNSFLLLQGIETLSLRMERHVSNAVAIADFLSSHPSVTQVHYAGLPSSRWHAAAQRYLPSGVGAVVAFELAGGVDAGKKFVDSVSLFSHLANIGDVRSLVIHPASTTHAQLSPAQQLASGVTPGLVRLSVGLEGIDDLIADLKRGLDA
ncbi:bifunctional o-acetylhomoserine/o-acetylserine sulfhydrylase [Kibdelosporangium philippinense]|uniref:Bifunctional o-acetylhomoserine/o-acetylserine sulfhydrylase n=1 Tax=Kibdelosporangium philippinense TaxID=211113 RepID=A0ABS8ZAV2_9PSEU|nr:bifunctional o-acetylhomoserine/o-acetylserine sulfhydrylase [Kibdelosporangium philippinense]MCE7004168.1 bifunctional o-acetylhomoserine/o-acetylserine sulfhydrylase [Kibdelosporangium philippinense]